MIKKIIITGGHHNSALVVAKTLRDLGVKVDWVGHRYAATGDHNDSAEYLEVKNSGFNFHLLNAGKSSFNLSNLWKIPYGALKSYKLVKSLAPDAVLSFGGYLGLYVAAAAHLRGIPVYLHEQTAIAGKANKFVARFARKIFLTWESSRTFYPASRSLLVGLPLRPGFFTAASKKLDFPRPCPTLLIMGGKQGSHHINQLIFRHLNDLLAKYNIVHVTGTSSATGDLQKAISLKESLPDNLAASYLPRGYIGEDELPKYMRSADLVISRSGAHTTYELAVLGKKSILIPYLHTHGKEQLSNARILEKAGLATIIPQSKLTYPILIDSIAAASSSKTPPALPLPRNAAQKIADEIICC